MRQHPYAGDVTAATSIKFATEEAEFRAEEEGDMLIFWDIDNKLYGITPYESQVSSNRVPVTLDGGSVVSVEAVKVVS